MEILVISDTHGRKDRIREVFDRLNFRPRAVLFLGDCLRDLSVLSDERYSGMDCYAVAGNNDGTMLFPADEPDVRTVCMGGCRIVMMHGHTFNVHYGASEAVRYAVKQGADVLLYGHTHKRCDYILSGEELGREKPLLVANPGSLGEPRDGKGAAFGVLTLRNGQPLFSHGELI